MSSAGRRPFGWYDDELAVIEFLFHKANSRPHGVKPSIKQICEKLNKDGRKTQTGKPWYPIAVGRILKKGLVYYKNLHEKHHKRNKKFKPKEYLDSNDYLTKEEVIDCRAVLRDSDRVLFEVLHGAGLRASECCGLLFGDIAIHSGKSQIDVRNGKGAKRRSVIIGPRLKKLLAEYIKPIRVDKQIENDMPVFLNNKRKQLKYSDLYSRIKKIRERSGVPCLHPHALRHTFGTYLYNYKLDLEYVRQQLGHSNINTTRIYAKTLSKSKLEQMAGFEESFDP